MSLMGLGFLSRVEYPTLTTPDAPGRKGLGKVAGDFSGLELKVWGLEV